VGFLLLEAAGVALLIMRQQHEHKVRRSTTIFEFAGRVFDLAMKAAKA
jgi:hypothetical protein